MAGSIVIHDHTNVEHPASNGGVNAQHIMTTYDNFMTIHDYP